MVFGYIFGYKSSNSSSVISGAVCQCYSSYYYHYYIPTSIKKVTVTAQTAIPANAFKNCDFIEIITLPTTTTSVGEYAFYNCSSLEEVTMPDSVSSMGSYVFYGCIALKRINSTTDGVFTLPTSLTAIPSYAFNGCVEITKVVVGDITEIGSYAFSGCVNISKFNSETEDELIIPSGVTKIGAYAFQNLSSIVKIVIPDTVTEIGRGAFQGCAAIEDITLPFIGNTATSTGVMEMVFGYIFGYKSSNSSSVISGAVCQCYSSYYYHYYIPTSIKKVTVTAQTAIPANAFKNCDFIEIITLPTTTTSVGEYAFYNCSSLEEVTMPDSVSSMGSYVFYGCIALKRINSTTDGVFTLPTSLTAIPSYAFNGCVEITKVVVGDITEIGSYAFSGCVNISKFDSATEDELIIPSGVTKIGDYAFQNLSSIVKIVIPDTVTEIGRGAFQGCAALEDITLPFIGKTAISPSNGEMVFGYIFGYERSNSSSAISGAVCQCYYSSYYYHYYIPTSIKKVTVTAQTAIPANAFKNCDFIEIITLPTVITGEGTDAYTNCSATISKTYETKTDMSWDGTAVAATFAGGSGTQDDPYLISTGAELALLSQRVKNGETFSGMYFRLIKNIRLNGKAFTPIGSKTNEFSGVFDGNGFVISNFTITVADSYLGVFGYVTGTIENLGVQGTINVSGTTSNAYAGLLAGYSTGTIQNCFATGTVTLSSPNTTHAGGLVGCSEGTITNCYSTATVTSTSSNYMAYAGGLVGYVKGGAVSGSYATGNVQAKGTSSDYSRNGGLIGYTNSSATVTNCYRSEIQELTRYTTVGSAYCEDGTAVSLEEIKAYVSANWSNVIWSFNNSHPRLIMH